MVWLNVPLAPVTVSTKEPAGVEVLVVSDIVEVLLAGSGLKLVLAPLGSPLELRVTKPLKPPLGVIPMV